MTNYKRTQKNDFQGDFVDNTHKPFIYYNYDAILFCDVIINPASFIIKSYHTRKNERNRRTKIEVIRDEEILGEMRRNLRNLGGYDVLEYIDRNGRRIKETGIATGPFSRRVESGLIQKIYFPDYDLMNEFNKTEKGTRSEESIAREIINYTNSVVQPTNVYFTRDDIREIEQDLFASADAMLVNDEEPYDTSDNDDYENHWSNLKKNLNNSDPATNNTHWQIEITETNRISEFLNEKSNRDGFNNDGTISILADDWMPKSNSIYVRRPNDYNFEDKSREKKRKRSPLSNNRKNTEDYHTPDEWILEGKMDELEGLGDCSEEEIQERWNHIFDDDHDDEQNGWGYPPQEY